MQVKERRPVWWDYRPPRHRDIGTLDGAPSWGKLRRERHTRIAILRAGHSADTDKIAKTLERADELEPANSPCCPINGRYFQIYAASRMYKEFWNKAKGTKLWFVTVADQADRIQRGSLVNLDVQAIQHRTRKRLKRTLPKSAMAFAVLEVKWEDETATYLPHHHIFVAGCERHQLDLLRSSYYEGKNDDGGPKMVVRPCNDPLRRFSYALKLNVFRQKKRTRKVRHRNQRLRRREFREHMLYLAAHDLTDFVFGINARLDGR